MPQTKVTTMESRKSTKRWSWMKETPTTRLFLGEGDLTLSWSIGPTRSFCIGIQVLHRIKVETTESGENLEQWPNTNFSLQASKEWQETQKVRIEGED